MRSAGESRPADISLLVVGSNPISKTPDPSTPRPARCRQGYGALKLQENPVQKHQIAKVVPLRHLPYFYYLMSRHTTIQSKFTSAFSLVELLVVIAVIAVIAAIAIPNITNITSSADAATKLRNAQQVASTWNNYVEAFYAVNSSNVAAPTVASAISSLSTGVSVTNTRLNVTNGFRLPGVTEATVATNKLTVDGVRITYVP